MTVFFGGDFARLCRALFPLHFGSSLRPTAGSGAISFFQVLEEFSDLKDFKDFIIELEK